MAQIREFESTTESYFILDGVSYPKVYEAMIDSGYSNTKIKLVSTSRDTLPLVFSTEYTNIRVDGDSFGSASEAISRLNQVVFSKGGGSGGGGTVLAGYKGEAQLNTEPEQEGAWWYNAHTAGTYTNFSGIVVTAADLDVVNGVANNRVILEVNNGVATKRVESTGTEGKSAYEVALANGFVGTEPQWLDSVALLPFENNFNTTVEKVTSVKAYGDNTAAYSISASPPDFVLIYKATAAEKITRLKLKIKTAGIFTVIKYNSTTATKTVLANYTVGVGDFEFLLNANLAANEYIGFENTSTAKIYVRNLAGSVYWLGAALTANSSQFSIELYKTSLTNPTFQTVISGEIDKAKLNTKVNELISDKSIKLLSRDITSIEYAFNTMGSGTGAVYGFKTDKTTIIKQLRVKAGVAGIMRFVAYKPAEGGNPSDTINLASAVPIVVGFNIVDVDATVPTGYYIGTITKD